MNFTIREIEKKDDKIIERIIRDCLIEYGGDHEGTAWADPNLSRFSEIYINEKNKYYVAENENGEVVGGVGIGQLDGTDEICELQKMYCIPQVRGSGVAHLLMQKALCQAKSHYKKCYLETLPNMIAAQRFYEKYGFTLTDSVIGKTNHYACEIKYIKELL